MRLSTRCRDWFDFFFNDTATTEIYTLSLHDALPIWTKSSRSVPLRMTESLAPSSCPPDRKSTRLNSSHMSISYAVFCLKKQTQTHLPRRRLHDIAPAAAHAILSARP